ncbi:hypothetical protein BGX34_001654 [Mortierella sp. NVP85]|nr:hypothetical protein BGX34_001654 [Mortierella sp. NVP85]
MVKLQLFVLAVAASVASAIELYEHVGFWGNRCDVPIAHERPGDCFGIHRDCSRQVSSVKIPPGWYCELYEGYTCYGAKVGMSSDVYSLADHGFNDKATSVICWFTTTS